MIDFEPDWTLYPFTSRWLPTSVGEVHYIDEGSGPALLFLHGSPTWSFLYRGVIERLRSRFRCIAIDYPGFGLSARPVGFDYSIGAMSSVVGEVVDRLELDDFVVVGQDWGGPIGLAVAAEREARTRGVALSNTQFWPVDAWPNRVFSAVMSSRPLQRRILENNLLIERVLVPELRKTLSESELDHYRAVQSDPAARVALAVMPRQIRAARPLLSKLERDVPQKLRHTPALAVWGMRDKVFRAKTCLSRLSAAFDDLAVVELPSAGHFVPEDAPEEFAGALSRRFG